MNTPRSLEICPKSSRFAEDYHDALLEFLVMTREETFFEDGSAVFTTF